MASKKQIGAIIKLDGEQQFKASMQNCKTYIAAMKSELKNIQSTYKGNANSLEALSAMQEKYAEIQKAAAAQVENMTKAYNSSRESEKKAKAAMSDMLTEYQKAEKELKEMQKSGTASAEALEEQSKKADEAQAMYDAYAAQVEKAQTRTNRFKRALAEAKTEEQEAKNALKQYAAYIKEAQESADGAAHSIDEYGNAVQDTADAAGEATSSLDVMKGVLSGNFATQALGEVVDKLREAATYAVKVGSDFEQGMSTVEALSGAAGSELDALKDKAAELGRETVYSSTEVTEAMSYMALAGWKLQQMLESINDVLNLAKSSQMELGEASDIVTDYITAFGLSAKDAAHFVDVMAYAQANSNTTTAQLGEAYKNCAATAGQFGYSVEETTSALMTMSNAGLKSGEAGTALNALMVRLATNTKGCAKELEQYGVHVYDSNGHMQSLTSILTGTAAAMSTLTDEEQTNLAKIIAGQNQYTGFLTVMQGLNEAAKKNGKSFEDYTAQLKDCDGTAQKMADTMGNNLKGDMAGLSSAVEGFGDAVYEYLNGPLRGLAQEATDLINHITDAITPQKLAIDDFIDSIDEASARVHNMMDSADSNYASSTADASGLQEYIEILDQARSKTSLTEYEQFRLNETVKKLSGTIPEFNKYVGDTNALLKLSADDFKALRDTAVQSYDEMMAAAIVAKRNAYMEAQVEAELTSKQAISANAEVENELAAQIKRLSELKKERDSLPMTDLKGRSKYNSEIREAVAQMGSLMLAYRETQKQVKETGKEFDTAKDSVADLDAQMQDIYAQYGFYIDESGNFTSALLKQADATEEVKDSAKGATKATDEITDSMSEAVASYKTKTEELKNADPSIAIREQMANAAASVKDFQDSLKNAFSGFSLFGDTDSIMDIYTSSSKGEMEKNAKISLDIMGKYADELKSLSDGGLSTEFLSYLTSQGQTGMEYIHNLATWTSDEELKAFQEQFDQYESYTTGTNDKVKDVMKSYAETVMSGVTDGYNAWYQYGVSTTQGLFDAIAEAEAALANGSISGDIADALQIVFQNNRDQRTATANPNTQTTINNGNTAVTNPRTSTRMGDITVNVSLDSDQIAAKVITKQRQNSRISGRR